MKRKKLNSPVLAKGEVTGHAHLLDGEVDVFEVENGAKQFELAKSVDLTHEEHKTITLPPGEWESDQVLEYDPFQEEARKVRD